MAKLTYAQQIAFSKAGVQFLIIKEAARGKKHSAGGGPSSAR